MARNMCYKRMGGAGIRETHCLGRTGFLAGVMEPHEEVSRQASYLWPCNDSNARFLFFYFLRPDQKRRAHTSTVQSSAHGEGASKGHLVIDKPAKVSASSITTKQ